MDSAWKKWMSVIFIFAALSSRAAAGEEKQIQTGSKVKMNYTLTVDGKVVDSSEGRGPLAFTEGSSQIIPGLDRQLAGLKVGDKREIDVEPAEAYGTVDPTARVEIPKAKLGAGDLSVGMRIGGTLGDGRKVQGTVTDVRPQSVMVDFNHPLAGKKLHFSVEILEIL